MNCSLQDRHHGILDTVVDRRGEGAAAKLRQHMGFSELAPEMGDTAPERS